MSDEQLFREVDEEVRRERLQLIWKRYGRYISGVVTAVIIVAVGVVAWMQFQERQRLATGERFAAAAKLAAQGELESAVDAFAAIADSSAGGYGLLAKLRQAALLIELGEVDGALALYDQISGDTGVDVVYRDLATLLAVMQQADEGDAGALIEKLSPLLNNENPWRFSARELTAVLAMRQGDTERARELFTSLSGDLAAPAGVRARAAELLAALNG